MAACKMAEVTFSPLFTASEVTSGVSHVILNSFAQHKKTLMYWSTSSKETHSVYETGKPKVQGKAKWIGFYSNFKREKGDINFNT